MPKNAFCATGLGGGVDPSCSRGKSADAAKNAMSAMKGLERIKKPKDIQVPEGKFAVEAAGVLYKPPLKSFDTSDATFTAAREKMMKSGREPKLQEVAIDSLVSPQPAVRQDTIKHMIEKYGSEHYRHLSEPVVVVKLRGKNFLFDGTHRATVEKLMGEKNITARVYK